MIPDTVRLAIIACAKADMSMREVADKLKLQYRTVAVAAGDVFRERRNARKAQAMDDAVAAYKAGASCCTAARAAGVTWLELRARLLALGITYEPRHTGPTSGPRFKVPADVMSDRRGANYKRVRDLLLAGKTRAEAAAEVGVTRATASLVAIDLEAHGIAVATTRSAGVLAAVRKAAEGGKYTADDVAELTGLPKTAIYAAAGRLKRQTGVAVLLKSNVVRSKHRRVRDFVVANPGTGPAEIADKLGVPYRVAAAVRLRVRKRVGVGAVPDLRSKHRPGTVAVMEYVLRNPDSRPEDAAAALGVSAEKINHARRMLRKRGSLTSKLAPHGTRQDTRSLMSYMRANPEQKPRDVAAAHGVSATRVHYVRYRMRKEQPDSLPKVRRSKRGKGSSTVHYQPGD